MDVPASALREGTARFGVLVAVWSGVALLFAVQGSLVAAWRGTQQPWWPSFGYALAIFSVWAALTPPVLAFTRRIEDRVRSLPARLALCAAGLPLTAGVHVALFVFLYWPLYGGGPGAPTPLAMGERMAVRNLDTNSLFYLAIVGVAVAQRRWQRRKAPTTAEMVLELRANGGRLRVPTREIVWVTASGNYAELRWRDATLLVDHSLADLARRLPMEDFARIHRGSIVQVDRIRRLQGIGHGDAMLEFDDGSKLRLSRRYRAGLLARIDPERD